MTSSTGSFPQMCSEVGLSCESCTSETARQLARACKGLRGRMISQLFVQIHVHQACAPMYSHFTAAYHAASAEPVAMAAVA